MNVAPNAELPNAEAGDISDARRVAQTNHPPVAAQNFERTSNDQEGLPLRRAQHDTQVGMSEVVYAVAAGRDLLMPNLKGQSVRDAARTCARLGLRIEARGQGRGSWQSAAAGASIAAGQVVGINFAKNE